MGIWHWLLIVVLAIVGLYVVFVVALFLAGRRSDARAIAGVIPDCVVFFGRLGRDRRIPRRHRALLFVLLGYLALPST